MERAAVETMHPIDRITDRNTSFGAVAWPLHDGRSAVSVATEAEDKARIVPRCKEDSGVVPKMGSVRPRWRAESETRSGSIGVVMQAGDREVSERDCVGLLRAGGERKQVGEGGNRQ